MTLGSERGAVQNPILRYAEEAGWKYLRPEEAMRLRQGEGNALLHDVFVQQLRRLNPGVVDAPLAEDVARRLMRVPPTIEGNLQAWEYLKGLKSVYVAGERRERNVRLVDPDTLSANTFHVTDEFRFTDGYRQPIRADVLFLINGIPLLVVETKAATEEDGIGKAYQQLRRYHEWQPGLLALLQLQALTNLSQFYYGPTWNFSRKALFNWREEQAGDFETLVKTFIHPRRLLRVLTEFILFTRREDELQKVVLRPHQMRAVERVVRRARDPEKRRALIWHTQGSGKTYTMLTVARQLIADPSFGNPTVLVLVDRNELESQLSGNLEALGMEHAIIAQSKRHLRDLLREQRRGLIVSMIHKFDDMPERLSERENIFVLVDEAHRTTGGNLGNYLMGALPRATYIGFTGTPIDRSAHGRGTFKVFGADDPRGYLDKYAIAESITDGTTVPLKYEIAPNELLVDRETLDREFLELAELEGVSDSTELDRVLRRAVTLRNMLKNDERVRKVARFIANHFRDRIDPMGYKAFVVTVDREACLMMKDALDELLPEEWSRVVMSEGHYDTGRLAEYHLPEQEEKAIRRAFRAPDELPKILIVTEKLLTGYDAPVLYCMYLDKPMRDHVLLQAIARVNRPYEDETGRRKTTGLIVDFVGIFDNLEKALAFDSKDVEGVVEGIDVLEKHFIQLIIEGREQYLPIPHGLRGDKAVEAVLEYFRDRPRRDLFYHYFRELQELFEILSPSPFLRPYLDEYDELARMYRMVRANYEPGVDVSRSFLRKTEQLVREHTTSGRIREADRAYLIDGKSLRELAEAEAPDTVKVFNLLRAIHDLVAEKGQEQPYLIPIGERAQEIARRFEARLITSQEALAQVDALRQEQERAEARRASSGLSPEGFAISLYLSTRHNLPEADAIARRVDEAFRQYPNWQQSEEQERAVRIMIYRALIEAGALENISEIATGVMRLFGRGA